ncbi:HupV protein [Mangrovimicrobium sediminis]|uniref:HupV protein n=1 Tax=Mangrovimicrobium sediminis TaxID=2562682 RepID=A0A4Z0M4H7_9GAMM|nr:nickel-dependent hydrogenase large subunit [Haliea sp. SAOS-164]TGD74337.1 HupV protein [Haliea sp. SAOS-164]
MSDATRRIVGPFNRVEGDLEVQLEVSGDRVERAWVVSPLYRGFEQILRDKDPLDALVYVPRICGICSVAQSVAAARALASLEGLAAPRNGELATNLVLANENVADHLTHFYLFFMPDFARETYAGEAWYGEAAARFRAVSGSAAAQVLPARAEFLHLMGLLAGKWPHSLALQPGGTTRSVESGDRARVLAVLFGFRQFLERCLFGDALENIVALDSAQALEDWCAHRAPVHSDFRHFLHIAEQLQLQNLGRAQDRFMSYGVYPADGTPLFAPGVFSLDNGTTQPLEQSAIREDSSHTWNTQGLDAAHPYDGVTQPNLDNQQAYTWCKSPRLGESPVEVGALARQVVNGHPLLRDLVQQSGGNVRNRIVARLLEIALVVIAMEGWARQLRPKEPFCHSANPPDEARGYGMIEAARGSLGHWISVQRGRIANYQIIAPTTWNFSPRDIRGAPGPLELALQGAPLRADESGGARRDPVAVQHIVRSFDPCMVCTVH